LDVHQAGDVLIGCGIAVVLDALDEAARAVADAGDRDTDGLAHEVAPSWTCGTRGSRGASIRDGDGVADWTDSVAEPTGSVPARPRSAPRPIRGRAGSIGCGARRARGSSGRRGR